MHKAPALAHRPRTEHALAAGGALVRALSLALALASKSKVDLEVRIKGGKCA